MRGVLVPRCGLSANFLKNAVRGPGLLSARRERVVERVLLCRGSSGGLQTSNEASEGVRT